MKNEQISEILTPAELGKRWKVAVKTLEGMRGRGAGPAWVKIAGSIRYRVEDVEAYEQAQRRGPEAAA